MPLSNQSSNADCSRKFGGQWSTGWMEIIALLIVTCFAVDGFAQTAWPDYPLPGPNQISRGSGQYFSWLKLAPLFLLFLGWVWLVDWVSRDAQEFDIPFAIWVPVVFFPFVIALFLGAFTIPMYAIGVTLATLSLFGPVLAYVVSRNGKVEYHQRVLTAAHLRFVASQLGKKPALTSQQKHKPPMKKGRKSSLRRWGQVTIRLIKPI